MKIKIIKIIAFVGILGGVFSCTKLDEKALLYDQVDAGKFGSTELELSSLVIDAYTAFLDVSGGQGIGGDAQFFPLTEVTSDEIVVPRRGGDWEDGGRWLRLKAHTYTKEDTHISNAWSLCYKGIGKCNRLLAILATSPSEQAKRYIAELKVLRAFYYYWLLDWYGNVPLSIDFANTEPPANSPRADVYAFIEKELLDNGKLLPRTGPKDSETYGHVNFYTAYAILAKLYLNAKVYTGTAQWQKALDACDTIIIGDKYALSPNYYDNFARDNNQKSLENIWVIPFDEKFTPGFHIATMTLHLNSIPTFDMTVQPWNGFATTSEFYNSYIDSVQNPGPISSKIVGTSPNGALVRGTADKRLANFIVGPQYTSNGKVRIMDNAAEKADPDSSLLTFTPYINELEPNAWRQAGARIGKFTFYNKVGVNMDNDFPIFRYADILLMKAEAKARITGSWNNADTYIIVNNIRMVHGGVDPLTPITEAKFLAERGREMFFEGWRRQDMIRFDTYNKAYLYHAADASSHVNIFPIPEAQLNANKKLVQNPGYPK